MGISALLIAEKDSHPCFMSERNEAPGGILWFTQAKGGRTRTQSVLMLECALLSVLPDHSIRTVARTK